MNMEWSLGIGAGAGINMWVVLRFGVRFIRVPYYIGQLRSGKLPMSASVLASGSISR